MTAKQAKKLTCKAINQTAKQQIRLREEMISVEKEEFQARLDAKIDSMEADIEAEAESGASYSEFSYPDEDLIPSLKAYFEKNGFRFSTGKEDAGYCIGDRWYMQISW